MRKKLIAGVVAVMVVVASASAYGWHAATRLSPEQEAAQIAALNEQFNRITAEIDAKRPLTVLAKNLAYARLDQSAPIRAFCSERYSTSSGRTDCIGKQQRTNAVMIDLYKDSLDNSREGMARAANACTEQSTRAGIVDWANASHCVVTILQGAIEEDRRAKL